MRSTLNSSVVWELTTEGKRLFHCGIVRGKNEFFRASLYVWYLQYWALCDALADFKQGSGTCLFLQTQHQNVFYEREAGRTDPYGPQEMASQARQASHQHYLCFAISCRPWGLLSSELTQPDLSVVLSKGSK